MKKKSIPKYVIPDGRFYNILVLFTYIKPDEDGDYPTFNYYNPTDKIILVNKRRSKWRMFRTLLHEFFHCAIDIFQHPEAEKIIGEKSEEARVWGAEKAAARELKIFKKDYKVVEGGE